jgi:hypothetical protein
MFEWSDNAIGGFLPHYCTTRCASMHQADRCNNLLNSASRLEATVGMELPALLRVCFLHIEVGLMIRAPSHTVWNLLVDTSRWAEWGPSIRAVECCDRFLTPHSSGLIKTVFGFSVPFAVTHFEPGKAWSWSIFGIPATTHFVESLGTGRCRLFFGVPILAFPYLLVCLIAIRRIAELTESGQDPASTS